jgi:hypothetical protein
MVMRCKLYDPDLEAFPADAYTVRGWRGVAWRVLGWELEPVGVILCPDCEYHALEREHGGGRVIDKGSKDCDHEHAYYCEEPDHERTGKVIAVMVGDDAHHAIDAEDLEAIEREEYCGVCGQIGCCHDGLEREDHV